MRNKKKKKAEQNTAEGEAENEKSTKQMTELETLFDELRAQLALRHFNNNDEVSSASNLIRMDGIEAHVFASYYTFGCY